MRGVDGHVIGRALDEHGLPDQALPIWEAIADWSLEQPRPFTLGICGTQGSGKSTMSAVLADAFATCGLRVALLSLDNFYLSHTARLALAADVHPLFATRGVPGTHDVALALETLAALALPGVARLPRFDKATDDPVPAARWPTLSGPADIILFEGWCVGARPQNKAALAESVNELERDDDPDGIWRRATNAALAGAYQKLFAKIDKLLFLKAPSFDRVFDWRKQQEEALVTSRGTGRGTMDDSALRRFIMHYERLTRHILGEMPSYANAVLTLGQDREFESLRFQ